MEKKTLAVIIPNYNHARFLDRRISSILAQSRKPDELIIVDDASTDNSVEVIGKYSNNDPVVRLLKNETNAGVNTSVTRGLAAAKSEYVCLLAADDEVLPGFFEKTMAILEENPRAGLCCSYPVYLKGEEHSFLSDAPWFKSYTSPKYYSPEEFSKLIGPDQIWIAGHTSILRKDAVVECGGFRAKLKWHSDWFVNYVLAFRYGVCFLPEQLSAMKIFENSYSTTGVNDRQSEAAVLWDLIKLLKTPGFSDVCPKFENSQVFAMFPHHSGVVLAGFHEERAWLHLFEETRRLGQTVSELECKVHAIQSSLVPYNRLKNRLSWFRPAIRAILGR